MGHLCGQVDQADGERLEPGHDIIARPLFRPPQLPQRRCLERLREAEPALEHPAEPGPRGEDRLQEGELDLGRPGRIDWIEGVLLEERLAQQAGDFEYDPVLVGQGVGAHELDDLEQLLLPPEQLDRLGPPRRPRLGDAGPVPGLERLDVERVRLGPTDGREVPGVGQLGI